MHRSFRAAAAAVGLSPAAFSERIQRLEEDLGAKLLSRGGRQVRLTPAGERLLPHARQLLTDARRCREVVGAGARQPYELNIGTRFELGLSWLVPTSPKSRSRTGWDDASANSTVPPSRAGSSSQDGFDEAGGL